MNNSIADLARRCTGPVFARGDSRMAAELSGFNTAVVHAPDVVVGAASEADVVNAIEFAKGARMRVHIHATGHGAFSPVTSGVMISMHRLAGVHVDAATRTAVVGAGATWGAVIAAASSYGFAPVGGSSPTVGVAGYLLGGGLGPLARSHGFGSDYVQSWRVVTGSGAVVDASADQNADLFWALCGGKYGLGVVTSVRLKLVAMSMMYGGMLVFGEQHVETVLRGWIDWTRTADESVTTSVAVPRIRGRRLLNLRFACPGPDGHRFAVPLRALAPLQSDTLGKMPVGDIANIHKDPTDPRAVWIRGMMLGQIDQDFASQLLAQIGPGVTTPLIAAEVRHVARTSAVPVEDSAVGGRGARYTLTLAGTPDVALFETALPEAGARAMTALDPWIEPYTNINFAGAVHSRAHYDSAWPDSVRNRLDDVRMGYDPDRLFADGRDF